MKEFICKVYLRQIYCDNEERKLTVLISFDNINRELNSQSDLIAITINEKQLNESIVTISINEFNSEYINEITSIYTPLKYFYNMNKSNKTKGIIIPFSNHDYIILDIYFSIEIINKFTPLCDYLLIPKNIKLDYVNICINIFKIKQIPIEYKIKELKDDYIETPLTLSIQFSLLKYSFMINSLDNFDLNTSVYLNIPKMFNLVKYIILIINKKDIQLCYAKIPIESIEMGVYNKMQYVSFELFDIDQYPKYHYNILLNIPPIIQSDVESLSNAYEITESNINDELLFQSKEIAKSIIWNISIFIKDIYIIPYNNNIIDNKYNITLQCGETLKEAKCISKGNTVIQFKYHTVNNEINEIPKIILYLNSIYSGELKVQIEDDSKFLLLNNKRFNTVAIVKYHIKVNNSSVVIPLIDYSNNHMEVSQMEESINDSIISNENKNEPTINKSYLIIITVYRIKFVDDIPILSLDNNPSLYISVNASTNCIKNIFSDNIYKSLLYHNIRFNTSLPSSFPSICLSIKFNSTSYYSLYYLAHLDTINQHWLNIDSICSLLISYEIIEESKISLIRLNQFNNISPSFDSYHIDFISLGIRNRDIYNNIMGIIYPKIIIDLNRVSLQKVTGGKYVNEVKFKGENANIEIIIDKIINLPKSEQCDLICEMYDDNKFIGKSVFNLNDIINYTKEETENILALINDKCTNVDNIDNIDNIDNKDIKIQIEVKDDEYIKFPQLKEYKLPGSDEHSQYFKYYKIEDIKSIPDLTKYKTVYDNNISLKHYRRYYDFPLEHNASLGLRSPFNKSNIFPLKNEIFKCYIRIYQSDQLEQLKIILQSLKSKFTNEYIEKEFPSLFYYSNIIKELKTQKQKIVRLYLYEISNLNNIYENVYIKVYINNIERYNSKKYNNNTGVIELLCSFPGDGILLFELWDNTNITGEKLIAYSAYNSIIDIEDRYYNLQWRKMTHKPIEKLSLISPLNKKEICSLYIWIDIDDIDSICNPIPFPLNDNNLIKYQIRAVVYEAQFYDSINSVQKTSNDLYVESYIISKKKSDIQFSDIHYNCSGYAFFNWRFVFDIDEAQEDASISFHLCDYSIDNEKLCTAELKLNTFLNICHNVNIPLRLTEKLYKDLGEESKDIQYDSNETFWINLIGRNVLKGKIKLNMEIIPYGIANIWKVGKGREEPNNNPHLRYPYERIKWTYKPCDMLRQLLGDNSIATIKKMVCYTLLIFYFTFFIPYIIYHLGGQAVNPYNYIYLKYIKDHK